MSRSVSYPSNAQVAFVPTPEWIEDSWDFKEWAEDLAATAMKAWPSMSEDDRFIGREDHALAGNRLAYFGVSEYCGLAAVWLVAKDDAGPLAEAWVKRADAKLQELFGELRCVAVALNGEAFYEARR